MTDDSYRRAATRVCRLWLGLRRQTERWQDCDPAPDIPAANPDVAAFNSANVERITTSSTWDVLVDVVAAVIRQELNRKPNPHD